ncbi:MAG: sensor histidine kinase [Actinomycetota bacterium]
MRLGSENFRRVERKTTQHPRRNSLQASPSGGRTLRPLDPLRSLKIKLGFLVTATCTTTAVFVWAGLHNGLATRYTLPLSVLLAVGVTHLLARGMTAPLRQMTAATQAMARGDYSRRVRATSKDEVGELARAFNLMASDLENVDQQRRELVANVSHELRTPVSALRAVLENIVDGVTEPDGATLRAALAQTERLGKLVTQLLDLSRVEAGALPLHTEQVDVGPFLAECVREANLGGRSITYLIDTEPEDLVITGDPERLHQVMSNLLENATRHAPPGTQVSVKVRHHEGVTQLDVTDNGPGIAASDRARIFDRFHRGSTSAAHDGGTGLGLAIARWAVELHGGHIHVAESQCGCTIRVLLPQPAKLTGLSSRCASSTQG